MNNNGQVSSKEVRAELDRQSGKKVTDPAWWHFTKSLRSIDRIVLKKPELTWSHPDWEKELQENQIIEVSEDDFKTDDLFGTGCVSGGRTHMAVQMATFQIWSHVPPYDQENVPQCSF